MEIGPSDREGIFDKDTGSLRGAAGLILEVAMFGLAVVPDPYSDESLLGYIYRLAAKNDLAGREVLQLLRDGQQGDAHTVFNVKAPPTFWRQEAKELLRPPTRSARVMNHRRPRFCPVCLRDARYWRWKWGLMLVTGCDVHGVALRDCCDECGGRLTKSALHRFLCNSCGSALTETSAPLVPVSTGALWLARSMAFRYAKIPAVTHHTTEKLTLEGLHELSVRIGIRSRRFEKSKPLKIRDAESFSVAVAVADAAGLALMDWPVGFYRLLDGIRAARGQVGTWKMRQILGPIYSDLYRALAGPEFNFVRDAFEHYIQMTWEAPLSLRNSNFDPSMIKLHRWVAPFDASRALGLTEALVRRMADREEIPTRLSVGRSGRVSRVVDPHAVAPTAPDVGRSTSLKQAALILGLGEPRVRCLLEAGMLIAYGGAPQKGERWWIDPMSIAQSVRPTREIRDPSLKSVSVAHLAKYCLVNDGEFIALMLAMKSGNLPVFVPEGAECAIGKWLVDRSEIAAWRSWQGGPCRTLSVDAAAKKLGVKQEVAYALARAGILRAEAEVAGRRAAQFITNRAMSRFKTQYILGTELASLAGTSPRQIGNRLIDAGFRPAAGPGIAEAPCRQYVWRRSAKLMAFIAAGDNYRKLQSKRRLSSGA
jgi:hypothetical protein